ncbi:hypothetical protein APS_0516 [Acetobacter pasteurianus subsp. pasteurianus LMG 1262 = NBRC 106471]|nr:hypothetical protein APS_0516 [Acetobacter pasteurianus subsp. pasteurianus LMG 1262 = NBRC 106471]
MQATGRGCVGWGSGHDGRRSAMPLAHSMRQVEEIGPERVQVKPLFSPRRE